jgi:NO-binding membrane sensor protein with MHYT domain
MTTQTLMPHYRQWLVAISFLISALGAYTALSVMSFSNADPGRRTNWFNTVLSGFALGGVGIWSMHFLGMLAFEVPVNVGYRPLETILSLLAAVLVSTLALGYMAARPFNSRRLWIAGPLTGLGVALMHYLGMVGMRFGGEFVWSDQTVALSIVIAIVAATAALWLAFHTGKPAHRVAAALLMGAAVCAMHYTGMAAATLVCSAGSRGANLSTLLRRDVMLSSVLVMSLTMAAAIGLSLLRQQILRMTQVTPAGATRPFPIGRVSGRTAAPGPTDRRADRRVRAGAGDQRDRQRSAAVRPTAATREPAARGPVRRDR